MEYKVENSENEVDLRSNRQDQELGHHDGEFRSYLNTNHCENNGLTVETSRVIISEMSSQVSRQLEELKSDLNAQILEVINTALAEKVLPSIENAARPTKTTSNTKWDLRSDGLHPISIGQTTKKCDPRSDRAHPSKIGQMAQENQRVFPRLIPTSSNRNIHCRGISVYSDQSDDGYDTCTYS